MSWFFGGDLLGSLFLAPALIVFIWSESGEEGIRCNGYMKP